MPRHSLASGEKGDEIEIRRPKKALWTRRRSQGSRSAVAVAVKSRTHPFPWGLGQHVLLDWLQFFLCEFVLALDSLCLHWLLLLFVSRGGCVLVRHREGAGASVGAGRRWWTRARAAGVGGGRVVGGRGGGCAAPLPTPLWWSGGAGRLGLTPHRRGHGADKVTIKQREGHSARLRTYPSWPVVGAASGRRSRCMDSWGPAASGAPLRATAPCKRGGTPLLCADVRQDERAGVALPRADRVPDKRACHFPPRVAFLSWPAAHRLGLWPCSSRAHHMGGAGQRRGGLVHGGQSFTEAPFPYYPSGRTARGHKQSSSHFRPASSPPPRNHTHKTQSSHTTTHPPFFIVTVRGGG